MIKVTNWIWIRETIFGVQLISFQTWITRFGFQLISSQP